MKLSFVTTTLRGRSLALVALALSATVAATAHAQSITGGGTAGITVSGELANGTYSSGPTTAQAGGFTNAATDGYNFVFTSASAATAGVNSQYGSNNFKLQAVAPQSSPSEVGGILALDGDFNTTGSNTPVAVDATVTGLGTVTNDTTTVSFYASDAQQVGYPGPTTDSITVCLGGICQSDSPVTNGSSPNDSPWVLYSYTFATTSASEVLSFLNTATPVDNAPAFALVDDITLTNNGPTPPVPEPGSLMLLSTGLLGVGGLLRSRFKKSEKAV